MSRERFLVRAAVVVLIVIWGTTWAAIRVGLEGIPPFTGVAVRFAIAGLLLLAVGRALRVEPQRGPRIYRLWLIETVFSFVLAYGIVYWAEQWVPSGLASVLFSTFPLFVAVLAHFWLPDEPFRARELTGIAVGFAGVVVIFLDDLALDGGRAVWVAVAVLGSPMAAAVSHVLVKKWGEGIHPVNLVTTPMLATGVVMGVVAILLERGHPTTFGLAAVSALLYLAIVGSAVAFTLYYWVLERVAATRLSLITLAIPVVAVLVGTLFLAEPFSPRTAVGAALVLLGVGITLRVGSAMPP